MGERPKHWKDDPKLAAGLEAKRESILNRPAAPGPLAPPTDAELAEWERMIQSGWRVSLESEARLIAEVRRLRALVMEHHSLGVDAPRDWPGEECPVCTKHKP